jgi:osmotically inducible protein OsmC
MKRKASAQWHGTGKEGTGSLSSTSGVLNNTPYSFLTRFMSEDGKAGTNPEELIAAGHAACFTMALSFQLSNAGFVPGEINTEAILNMEQGEKGWSVNGIHLEVNASVPGIDDAKFQELATSAKQNCPISRLLSTVEITMTAVLK